MAGPSLRNHESRIKSLELKLVELKNTTQQFEETSLQITSMTTQIAGMSKQLASLSSQLQIESIRAKADHENLSSQIQELMEMVRIQSASIQLLLQNQLPRKEVLRTCEDCERSTLQQESKEIEKSCATSSVEKEKIEEIEKSCATSVVKEKIFVKARNGDAGGFQFSEFYTLDLRNGQVSECPYALLADSGFNTMVSLGSCVYVVGALRPEELRCKTKPPHSKCTKKGLYHKFLSYLDLANDNGDGWKEAPCLSNGPSPDPVALAFGGKIYVFHTNDESATAHVFDPISNKWETLLPPPGVPFFDTEYAASDVADSQNNRILVHFVSIQSVFAYYPANNQWELVLKSFSLWSSKLVFVDGVIFLYMRKEPELVAAYHVATKKWLNIVFTSELPRHVWRSVYDAMFHLGSDLMCLAVYYYKHSPLRTQVILTKFRFEFSPHNPADLLITPLPDETYTIDACASVNRILPF